MSTVYGRPQGGRGVRPIRTHVNRGRGSKTYFLGRHKWMAPYSINSAGQQILNLALHGSNEIVCVSYWGFIPKLQFKICLILLSIREQSEWKQWRAEGVRTVRRPRTSSLGASNDR